MSSFTATQIAEFDLVTDEGSILLAAERIRRGNVRAEAILRGWEPGRCPEPERRRERRRSLILGAFFQPVVVRDGRAHALGEDDPIAVLTRDLSPHGIGFQHDSPLRVKHGILEFDLWVDGTVELLVEQRWSRIETGSAFRHFSGCRILGVARLADGGHGGVYGPQCGDSD